MTYSRTSNKDERQTKRNKSHGLPFFFVYIPFLSSDDEKIVISFAVAKTVFQNAVHISKECEPPQNRNRRRKRFYPKIYAPMFRKRCLQFPEQNHLVFCRFFGFWKSEKIVHVIKCFIEHPRYRLLHTLKCLPADN